MLIKNDLARLQQEKNKYKYYIGMSCLVLEEKNSCNEKIESRMEKEFEELVFEKS